VRLRDEDGFVGGFEALPFGLLVFVVGTLLLVNAWGVVDGNLAASAAAREAVRAYVETGDAALAEDAAVEALVGHGKAVGRADLRWLAVTDERCRPVTAEVRYRVPAIALPWVGGFGGVITTTATHTELVDPFRSGLATTEEPPCA
jgi:hypothetical protein